MSCTSKLQQKYFQHEWPDDWQNQFIKLKKVWSNKIKTTENIRLHRPVYINTFENQILSEYTKNASDSSSSSSSTEQNESCEFYSKYKQKEKINKERENKLNKEATKNRKKILEEIPSFIQILQQLHHKISNILEMSDDELCRHLHAENKSKQRRKRRPKRKYKLHERTYRTATCSVKSTSSERDYETESLISSSNEDNDDDDDMKLSIVHNMSERNSNNKRQDDQSYSIKINYVDKTFRYNQARTPRKNMLSADTVDDVNQVSSNCLLIPLIANTKIIE